MVEGLLFLSLKFERQPGRTLPLVHDSITRAAKVDPKGPCQRGAKDHLHPVYLVMKCSHVHIGCRLASGCGKGAVWLLPVMPFGDLVHPGTHTLCHTSRWRSMRLSSISPPHASPQHRVLDLEGSVRVRYLSQRHGILLPQPHLRKFRLCSQLLQLQHGGRLSPVSEPIRANHNRGPVC